MIGEKIKKLRQSKGMNSWELGVACKNAGGKSISGVSIHKYETEVTSPTVRHLEAIAKATNTRLILEFHPNPKK